MSKKYSTVWKVTVCGLVALGLGGAVASTAVAASPRRIFDEHHHRLSGDAMLRLSLNTVATARHSPRQAAYDLGARAIVELRAARGGLRSREADRLVEMSLGNLISFQQDGHVGHIASAEQLISQAIRTEEIARSRDFHHVSGGNFGGTWGPRAVAAPPVIVAPRPVVVPRRPAPGLSIGGRWGQVNVRF